MADFEQQMQAIAQLQQQRARLTATASVQDKRVTVTVNANGIVIETKFGSDIDELDYEEIAAAVTEAAQQAADEVAAKGRELAQPLMDQRMKRQKLSEMVEGFPDLESHLPTEPSVSTAPPGSYERMASESDAEQGKRRSGTRRSGATDSSW